MPTPAEAARNRLQECFRRVPKGVLEGNVNVARRFKDWAALAAKALANRRAPSSEINRLIREYAEFE